MRGHPVPCDGEARGDPDAVVRHDVVEQYQPSGRAPRVFSNDAMAFRVSRVLLGHDGPLSYAVARPLSRSASHSGRRMRETTVSG